MTDYKLILSKSCLQKEIKSFPICQFMTLENNYICGVIREMII